MNIMVNGESHDVAAGTSVASLLEKMNFKPTNVAVELNRRLIRSERYDTPLKEGDELEIVTFVGGG